MRISLLCADVSTNCLGRSFVLAQLLERNHTVEIVGPELGDGIWHPIRDAYDYRTVPTDTSITAFPRAVPKLLRRITGDVVYANKPRTSSYGVGLLASLTRDRPLVLDIDDWDLGFSYTDDHPITTHLKEAIHLDDVDSMNYKWIMERFAPLADARTVSNQFLASKFGGTIIPHARDTDRFDPAGFDPPSIREAFELPLEDTLVLFSGTPRSYKGVADLIEAIDSLDRPDVRGVIVGAHDSAYVRELKQVASDQIIFRGFQPFDELPKWVAAADVVAIPQRQSSSTAGQLPAKLFDAMAMAKPIVTTDVSDIQRVLCDAGVIVDPSSPDELAVEIERLVDDPERRGRLGAAARRRCTERYSYDAVAPTLDRIVRRVV